MKRFLCYTLCVLACMGFIFCVLFTSLQLVLNDRNWFSTEYYRLDTSRKTGISHERLRESAGTIADYFDGRVETPKNIGLKESDLSRLNAFKKAYVELMTARNISALVCITAFVAVAIVTRRGSLPIFSTCFFAASCVWFIPIVTFAVAANTNFSSLQAQIVNALYMGNAPSLSDNSILTAIFPDAFLFDLTMRSLQFALIPLCVILIASIIYMVIKQRWKRSPAVIPKKNSK